MQLARKVALVQVDYENEAGRVKSLKIQTLSRCNEGTFVDGPLQHPIVQTVIFVIETISLLKVQQVKGSLQLAIKVALDQVAYENEARGVKSLKIKTLSWCNEGTSGTDL